MERRARRRLWGRWAAVLAAAALAAGCGAARLEYPVGLRYEGATPARRFQRPVPVAVTPLGDLRSEKRRLGQYRLYNTTYTLISQGGPAAAAMDKMTTAYLRAAGLAPRPGTWDGNVDTLDRLKTDYALFGEIRRLDFTGRGLLPRAENRGTVIVELRLGGRREHRVWRRTVEVSPDELQVLFLPNEETHLSRAAGIIRRAISRAVEEGLKDLIVRISP